MFVFRLSSLGEISLIQTSEAQVYATLLGDRYHLNNYLVQVANLILKLSGEETVASTGV